MESARGGLTSWKAHSHTRARQGVPAARPGEAPPLPAHRIHDVPGGEGDTAQVVVETDICIKPNDCIAKAF